jgi:3-oxoadipate enol-lactonase
MSEPVRLAATLEGPAGAPVVVLGNSLGGISAPTLVIAGAEDPATPPWHGARIASAVGGSRLRVIRGGSHMANISQPGEVTATLPAHLTGAPGR